MRLLHIDFDDLNHPWGGGQARRTFEINRWLADARGWQIDVVTGGYPGARPLDLRLGDGRLTYHRAGGGPFPLNVLSFLARLPLLSRRFPHCLLIEDFTSPIGPAGAPWWSDRPVVASAQYLFAGQMSRKYHLPFDIVERRALRAYRWGIALAESGASYLHRFARNAEIAVIPQGLNPGDFVDPGSIDGGGEYALFLGRLDAHQKGIDVLLHAWALIPPVERPPLVIAGGGRDRRRLERLAEALGLTASVRFAGRVTGAPKQALLQRAALLCMPSRYETFGIVAREAAAAGKPVIASSVAGLREATPAGALHVPPGAPGALAGAALRLWHDRDLRQHLGRAGRRCVEGLTWDRVAAQQGVFYERALAGAARDV